MKKLRLFSIMFLLAISCCLFSACGSNITLTINFDSNGGTSCKSIEYVVGKSFNMPDDPTKENYVFGGWYTDNDKWNEPLTVNTITNYPLSKSIEITAYAKWLSINYIIRFDSNGGETCEDLFVDNINTELPQPKKAGYIFDGWYVDSNLEAKFSTQLPIELTNNQITIYAKWERNLKVIFHFDNGDENAVRYFDNDNFSIPQNIKKEHFSFINWSFDKDSNIVYDQYLIYKYENNGTLDLYALWEEDPISKVEIYDKGNIKDLYDWNEEIDVSKTLLKITYYDGSSRIAQAIESKSIRETKYYAKTFTPDGLGCKSGEKSYNYLIMRICLNYKPATESYVFVPINIRHEIKNITIENYNDSFNIDTPAQNLGFDPYVYKNGEEIISDNAIITIEDINGVKKQYNLKEFYEQNKEDFLISDILVGANVLQGSYYDFKSGETKYTYTIKNETICFDNNFAYINRNVELKYKTATVKLSYKLLLDEIEFVSFVTNDFYPGDWIPHYEPFCGGIVGSTDSKIDYYYKTMSTNVSLLKQKDYECVRVLIVLKNKFSVMSDIESIFDSSQFEIIDDIYFEEDIAIAKAKVKINGTEFEIISDELPNDIKSPIPYKEYDL